MNKSYEKCNVHNLLTKFRDVRHLQLAKDTVVAKESDFQVKNNKFRSPGAKNDEKLLQKNDFVMCLCFKLSFTDVFSF